MKAKTPRAGSRAGGLPAAGSPRADETGLWVNPSLLIPLAELEFSASRSSGPGGQHVNTSSTRVDVVWNVRRSAVLGDPARTRVLAALASRLSAEGDVRVVASDTRSQKQNRELALERLAAMIHKALLVRKARKKTKPGRGAVERRLAEKKIHSSKKANRAVPSDD